MLALFCGAVVTYIANKLVSVDLREVCSFLNELRDNLFKVQLHNIVYIKGFVGGKQKNYCFLYTFPGGSPELWTLSEYNSTLQCNIYTLFDGMDVVILCVWLMVL
jgi:hypothetical protein